MAGEKVSQGYQTSQVKVSPIFLPVEQAAPSPHALLHAQKAQNDDELHLKE